MKVSKLVNCEFNELDLQKIDNTFRSVNGWVLEDYTIIYSENKPKFHPYTGEILEENNFED